MLNTNIALQVRSPEFESPVNQLAKVMQLQGMQQEQGLNRLKMDSYARDQERRNKLLSLTQGWGADTKPEQRVSSLQGAGFFDEADKLEKGVLERRKVENDAFKGKAEVFGKYLGGVKDYTTRVFANPTPESAAAALDAAEQLARGLGLDVSADIASQRRMLAGLQTNEQIKQWAAGHSLNADKLLPIIQKSNTGGATITEAVNPLTGMPTLTGSTANTATPDAVMTDTRTREEGDKNRAVTTRGQNLTDARAREQFSAGGNTYDAERGVVVNTRTQTATPVTAGGQPLAPKLSEAVKKELLSISQQRAVIEGAVKAVKETPTAFGMARGLATMAGSVPESIAGRNDSDAERQARAYVFNNVSSVINERAGAAQSAQELARLRSFLPAETDTSDQIVSKFEGFKQYLDDKERGTRPQPAPPAGGPRVPKISSDSEYYALPSGSTFVGPDGKTRRKP